MPHILGSSVSYRIAIGPQQDRKTFMIRSIRLLDRSDPELERGAKANGFSSKYTRGNSRRASSRCSHHPSMGDIEAARTPVNSQSIDQRTYTPLILFKQTRCFSSLRTTYSGQQLVFCWAPVPYANSLLSHVSDSPASCENGPADPPRRYKRHPNLNSMRFPPSPELR